MLFRDSPARSGSSWALGLFLTSVVAFSSISARAADDGINTVRIEQVNSAFRLVRNGQPFFIKGAVGWERFDELSAAGANAVRTGPSTNVLDKAHKLGLSALVGLPLGLPRRGFDYQDATRLNEQRQRIRKIVEAHKRHPAVLMWAIGNEPTIFTEQPQREALWKEVNILAEMIKSIDPAHPVISVVGGEQWREHIGELDAFCPALDAVGLNAYADMLQLPEDLARQKWKRPYIITEFGPRGHWQVGKTAWNARLEDSSTEKAAFYRKAYEHAIKGRPACLGSFAFLWGNKMEKTHTWYGMFLDSGERTEAVDMMSFLWRGTWPANRAPSVNKMTVRGETARSDSEGRFRRGEVLVCAADASDPENDALSVTWDLRRDVADDPRVGGDFEPHEPAIAGAVISTSTNNARILLPTNPGKYRVFVYARDGKGGAATANCPLITR